MSPPIDDSVCVVTGASSGIGLELARLLAPRVRVLVLVARRVDRLEALAKDLGQGSRHTTIEVRSADLSDVDQVRTLAEGLIADHGGVDILVNNAGLGDFDLFECCPEDKLLGMLMVNMVGLTLLTRLLLPGMVERRSGGILNTSSSFGLVWMPGFSTYAATKQYVTAFSDGLRCELLGTGVTVTQLCPGPVRTEFVEVAGNKTSEDVPSFLEIDAWWCAEKALEGFEKGRAMVIPGMVMKLVTWVGSWTPRAVMRVFMGLVGRYLRLEIEAWHVMQEARDAQPAPTRQTGDDVKA